MAVNNGAMVDRLSDPYGLRSVVKLIWISVVSSQARPSDTQWLYMFNLKFLLHHLMSVSDRTPHSRTKVYAIGVVRVDRSWIAVTTKTSGCSLSLLIR